MKFDKFDFSLPLFCKAVRYQIRKSYQLFYLLSSSMFYQEFSFVCLEDVHYTKVTLNSPHSSHIVPNDVIGSNQLPIVLLFAASEIIWVLAPHERIFQKYFIADVLCLWGTPPSAWNIVVRCSSRGSIIPSLGTSKEVRGSWVEGLFAGCATHVRYGRSLTHRHRLLSDWACYMKSSGFYWVDVFNVDWATDRRLNDTRAFLYPSAVLECFVPNVDERLICCGRTKSFCKQSLTEFHLNLQLGGIESWVLKKTVVEHSRCELSPVQVRVVFRYGVLPMTKMDIL